MKTPSQICLLGSGSMLKNVDWEIATFLRVHVRNTESCCAEVKISFEMPKAGPRNVEVEDYVLVMVIKTVPRNNITALQSRFNYFEVRTVKTAQNEWK